MRARPAKIDLAARGNARAAREQLLRQCRPGTKHPADEYRAWPGSSGPARLLRRRAARNEAVHERVLLRAVVARAVRPNAGPARQIGCAIRGKRRRVLARFVKQPAERKAQARSIRSRCRRICNRALELC